MTTPGKAPLVLLHGWGVNQRIWSVKGVAKQGNAESASFLEQLSTRFHVHLVDLPGYGDDLEYEGAYDLNTVAGQVLHQAPPRAIWVAWSLGATVALHAAWREPARFSALQLISPTPCFMANEGWEHGASNQSLAELQQRFEQGYASGLKYFLMLQTDDRTLIRNSFDAIGGLPSPKPEILMQSLNLLTETHWPEDAKPISVPLQIVWGLKDRIVPPAASRSVVERLSATHSVQSKQLPGGHLCFLESQLEYFETLNEFASVTGGC